jgi:hypothetical protein
MRLPAITTGLGVEEAGVADREDAALGVMG